MGGDQARSGSASREAWTLKRYADESRSGTSSALLTAPIVLSYEVGLLLLGDRGVRNAADALIDQGLTVFGRPAALIVNLLVLAIFVGFALRSSSRKATPIGLFVPVLVESALYACVLAPALLALSYRAISSPEPSAAIEGVVLSLGAGFYEEVVFRLGMIGGTLLLLRRGFGITSGWITLAVLVVSSAAFSWFHHLGPGSEPFEFDVFLMRLVAGLLLGALFILRGFGVVCYTHVIYDLLCLFGRS